jgi:hypothetical protein
MERAQKSSPKWKSSAGGAAVGAAGHRCGHVRQFGYNPGPLLANELIGKDNPLRW